MEAWYLLEIVFKDDTESEGEHVKTMEEMDRLCRFGIHHAAGHFSSQHQQQFSQFHTR
jgi:hypothetical protein